MKRLFKLLLIVIVSGLTCSYSSLFDKNDYGTTTIYPENYNSIEEFEQVKWELRIKIIKERN